MSGPILLKCIKKTSMGYIMRPSITMESGFAHFFVPLEVWKVATIIFILKFADRDIEIVHL